MNKRFLERVQQGELQGQTTLYNLMEVCGILSFNLSPQSLEQLFIGFAERYNVGVLFPEANGEQICFGLREILDWMKHKMSLGDALVASVTRQYRRRLDYFVTWNAAHFAGKLPIPVITPDQA